MGKKALKNLRQLGNTVKTFHGDLLSLHKRITCQLYQNITNELAEKYPGPALAYNSSTGSASAVVPP